MQPSDPHSTTEPGRTAQGIVCAVVVTFNRKTMLRTCLASLLRQERPADQIVIIDNASSDGTPELLASEFPDLLVVRLERNTGGAGGFNAGMRWAYDHGFEWMWLMDDDVEMEPSALRTMLDHSEVGDFIHSRKRMSNGPHIWESIWNVSACHPVTLERDLSFANGKPWVSVSYGNFEGPLINRKVVDRIGFPDIRYFIGGDDTIYGFLASFHVRVIYINQFGVIKRIPTTAPARSKMQYYLHIRNLFLNREHFESVGLPVPRKWFLASTLLLLLGYCKEILTVPGQRRWANFKAAITGFLDGWNGRFGPPPWLR
jgi:rhamnopyranosyl-N-acetylglucosaminyl-diphospho-decaprenol beta-1,3/1,4-galactofuranosyltransferase